MKTLSMYERETEKLRWIWIVAGAFIIALAIVFFSACTDTRTTVTPGVVTTHDNQTKPVQGSSHTLHLSITPATQPAFTSDASVVSPHVTSPTSQQFQLPNGQLIAVPFGSAIVMDYNDNTPTVATTRFRDATSTGAGFTSDKDLTGQVVSKPDMVDLRPVGPNDDGGGSDAKNGGSSFGWKPFVDEISAASSGAKVLMAIGVGFMVAGIGIFVAVLLALKTAEWLLLGLFEVAGVVLIGAGVALDTHPGLFIAALLLIAGLVGFYIYHKSVAAKATAATTASGTTTPTTTSATSSPGIVATVESDVKAQLANLTGLVTGLFHANAAKTPAPATPTAAQSAAEAQLANARAIIQNAATTGNA